MNAFVARTRTFFGVFFGRGALTLLAAFSSGGTAFWAFRRRVLIWQFRIQYIGFSIAHSLRGWCVQAPVLWRLFTSTFSAIAATFLSAAMTLAADTAAHRLHGWIVAIHIHLPGLQQNYINATATAILQLSVVIIGLYAAAFSMVASTVYGRIYGDVRELLLKDIASNAFLRSMAFVAAYTAFLLLAQSCGIGVGYISVMALTIALVSSIQAFVTAGIGIFRLFDPHKLLPQLQGDLAEAISSSTSRGYRSDTSSFQNAYRERAERNLLALEHMLEASDRAEQVADLASFALHSAHRGCNIA
jgi:hypothetical protein